MHTLKKILIYLIILLFPLISPAQTFFSPVIGVDYAKIEENKNFQDRNEYNIYKNRNSIKSIFFGASIEKVVSHNVTLNLKIDYTKKVLNAQTTNFIPIDRISFNYYRGSLQLLMHPLKNFNWSAGIGPSVQYIPHYTITLANVDEDYVEDFPTKLRYGLKISTGYELYNVGLNIYYNHEFGLYKNQDKLDDIGTGEESEFLQPIKSFGISISYKFTLSKGRN